ncbi:Uncharacterised protein [Legionella pneumophila]|nr:Uncharacterised protein [Legionella pneumophila]
MPSAVIILLIILIAIALRQVVRVIIPIWAIMAQEPLLFCSANR